MSLKEHVYSVLVVSAAENFNDNLSSLLPETRYSPIKISTNISAAKREYTERSYDFVIINSPLPDDNGTRFAIDIATSSTCTAVMVLARADFFDDVFDTVAEHGVFVLAKPLSKATVGNAMNWMISAREHLRRSEKQTRSIEDKMKEIRIVNKAKWLLISELNMSESEAHRYIEKQAMDLCVSKREIAENIIKTYS
ncbi:MAG: response regulator [Lachnospiraceae bacterium]|nr:response regulator [Lachnospiraceae bacterium]